MEPSGRRFTRNTHLHPMRLDAVFLGTRSQVPCCINALNSDAMAAHHSEETIACDTHVGSWDDGKGCFVTSKYFLFGLCMLCMDRVMGLEGSEDDVDMRSNNGVVCGGDVGVGKGDGWMLFEFEGVGSVD